jgi:hypothetical protein
MIVMSGTATLSATPPRQCRILWGRGQLTARSGGVARGAGRAGRCGILTFAGLLVRQVRIGLRDRGDRKLAKHILDQTRSTDGLAGYSQFIEARKTHLPGVRKESKPEDASP